MPEIRVEGLTKRWEATTAVDGISFTIADGAFAVLLGPSGCGKSTTLRLIAGLDQVSGGRILIGDQDVTDLPPAKRALSMVFQNYALFPHLSVAENIAFGLRVRRVPAKERQERLKRAADLLGLGDLMQRKPSQLSGGQQQRVALGRAIVAESKVCLMDEPLSNLDAKLRNEMRREIRELQQRLDMTMLYVTHDQAEAMSMADQVILLNHGRIEQDARPAVLYNQPATAFTAGFIGTPPMKLVDPAVLPGHDGDDRIGVRPEAVRLVSEGGMAAVVEAVEYLGADTILSCRINDQMLLARHPGEIFFDKGAAVRLDWEKGAEHHFDRDSGQRLTTPASTAAKQMTG
ncbi:MAG: ABC transporter ATP-binding protein [Geminicoccaceae bacterium]